MVFALAPAAAGARSAARPTRTGTPAGSRYPAGATRPFLTVRPSELAREGARSARGRRPAGKSSRARRRKKPRKPALHGDPLRALLAFEAMQRTYYIQGSGLYNGEPFSYLWPFSQALAANVTLANVHGVPKSIPTELRARMIGLRNYLDTDNSGQPEGTFTSTLAAFDGTVAPPAGPGGTKYYDDNDWVGIELMRVYTAHHEPAALGSAEAIMAFEMAGWSTNPQLPCPGGIPFSNDAENTDRNTVTNAPAAELAVQLYRATHNVEYLRFAETAYEWVRRCLLLPNGMYADHINARGVVEPMLWSYGQGTMIGAGALLYQATGNAAFLYQARQTARAALSYFTPERLAGEIPFFPSVYFRNVLYLDSVTHDPPGAALAQGYVDYAWQHQRLAGNLFVAGSPPSAQLLVQAAIVQIYGLLSSSPHTYF
ncbi:MAG TPA: glycoside hydrolase family 76 protein [Solirubrobacteraceae bacterium]